MRPTLEDQLMPAPAAVRKAMLEKRADLAPGAAAVIGRLFSRMKENGDPRALPRAASFRAAASSEPTFRLLLRTLTRFAPEISTAEATDVSAEWYAKRRKTPSSGKAITKAHSAKSTWPSLWLEYDAALEDARIKSSSKKRYRASVDRCAVLLDEGLGAETLGFLAAAEFADGFINHPDHDRRVRPITAANYIEALITLGRYGGAPEESLNAMRLITDDLRDQARGMAKNKEQRIAELMGKRGFLHIADRIGELLAKAHELPSHSAAGRRSLQAAMVCSLIMNKPPRKGDMVAWRLGHEIVRETDGTWFAQWEQEKTGRDTEAGALWPEVCLILDRWTLGGRPDRLVHLRYGELEGCSVITLSNQTAHRNLPTELTHAALGVPSHDLRTLAADYLRRHNPSQAADIIATHLGHGNLRSGKAYRSECSGQAGQDEWAQARKVLSDANNTGRIGVIRSSG